MNYKVLYRKYRPDDFDKIIGQDYIITTLKNSIKYNNVSHAYIFSGPRGTGKTSTAKVFSKAINCLQSVDGSPCGKCEFCTNYEENPDIIEIDAASNNGVDEIRNLIDNIKLTPTNGKYKVYIIDEVHMLTQSAFNALLLTLEEPPKHAIFILATTNVEAVPITILSRCQRFDFKKISLEIMEKSLKNICKLENIDIEDDAINEIAYLSDGGMRDALSLLDQMSKRKDKITIDLIEKQIKTISKKEIDDLISTIENNNVEQFLKIINDYRERSLDYKTFIKKIIDALGKKAKLLKIGKEKSTLDFSIYKSMIIELSNSLTKINVSVDPYTILEMIFLEYFKIDNLAKADKKEKNEAIYKNRLENNIKINKIKNNSINNDLINVRINNCFVTAKKEKLEEVKRLLEQLVNGVEIDGKIKSLLLDSNVVVASDTNLILTCVNEHLVNNANEMLKDIERCINNLNNIKYKIIFISERRWNEEKKKYVENIKNGIKYSYIEEKTEEDEVEIPINDVFDTAKVEII